MTSVSKIKMTLERLSVCGYEKFIVSKEANIHEYETVLFNAAKEAYTNGNDDSAAALELLSLACSPELVPSRPRDPFKARFVLKNQRSIIPADFEIEHGDLFAQFAPMVQDAELASRLGDLGWVISKNIETAKIAVESYIQASNSAYCQQNWFEKLERLERALRLALLINSEKVSDVIAQLLTCLDPNASNFNPISTSDGL